VFDGKCHAYIYFHTNCISHNGNDAHKDFKWIYTDVSVKHNKTFIMFIIVLGQHVSILTESSSGLSKKIYPYLKCLKMRCGISNAYVLDITVYKMRVSFCSYCTIGIPNSKTSPVRMKDVTRMYCC